MAGLETSAAPRGRGRGRGIAPHTAPGLGRGIAPQTAPGLGRGSRSRVNWSGDATRPNPERPGGATRTNPEQPKPPPVDTAWDRVSARIFSEPSLSADTEKQQQLLDDGDISEHVLELRWEPVERDCYMLLANMLGDSKRASNFR
jgi:hypothetical protein